MLGAVLLALSMTAFTLGTGLGSVHAQGGTAVSIVDFAFQPASIEVPAGSTVTWTNAGAAPHTVTADDGAFDSGQLKPGESFSQTFTTPGTYTYHCEIHPQMMGTMVVTEAAAAAAPAAPAAPTAATAPAAPAAPAASTQDQGGTQATTGTTKLPKTGVGTMAIAQGSSASALLAVLAAGFLGIIAVRTQRRA
jgi:plastocyanin